MIFTGREDSIFKTKRFRLKNHPKLSALLHEFKMRHRFAIEYHRQLRGKGQVHSILDDIEGIGPARRKALMRHYLSLDAIKAASIEELAKLPSMNEKAAQAVYNFFHT